MQGDDELLHEQFQLMIKQGIRPTSLTFSRVLTGYGAKNHIEKLLNFHEKCLSDEGLQERYATKQSYSTLLSQLGGTASLTSTVRLLRLSGLFKAVRFIRVSNCIRC